MTTKLNVLHVITGLNTGGAERALYNLLNGGLAKRFNNHVISLIDEGTMGPLIRELDVPVTTLEIGVNRNMFNAMIFLRQVVNKFKPHIVQGWMYHGNVVAMIARFFGPANTAMAWGIRHSLYDIVHEKPVTRQVIRANRFFSSAPNALLYNSRLSRVQHENFGFFSRNSQVIPNGIDIQRFSFSLDVCKRVRFDLGIPESSQVVGHVARLHPMKGHAAFLRAAVNLAYRFPRTHFLLSGRNVTMEEMELEQLVPYQVRDRFHLLGERNDVFDLMNAMDVFCQSSCSEAFPNVLGEAMASEVPCVATDVGDSAAIVGDTGCIVQPNDDRALIAGMERILTMPPKERRALGVSARGQIEKNYTLGAIVNNYLMLYEKIVLMQKRAV